MLDILVKILTILLGLALIISAIFLPEEKMHLFGDMNKKFNNLAKLNKNTYIIFQRIIITFLGLVVLILGVLK
ncbi:hypothetical protein [Clostridium grantii]|uniref:Uncharacterized protein n=1 Tax=Clostridium grantii DSM 8605 TaxID=1121316 RepID=A0A1M5UU78_9CLOT|nr:hypothetical protein [Clostridium grantii]SHH66450.1 hypothetical protein SAMN02745207_01899 [Clostridium grantii DSM 8605]